MCTWRMQKTDWKNLSSSRSNSLLKLDLVYSSFPIEIWNLLKGLYIWNDWDRWNHAEVFWNIMLHQKRAVQTPSHLWCWQNQTYTWHTIVQGGFFNWSARFSVPKWKKLAQPTRSSFTLKISWKTSPGWPQLVFHFGTENRADQLKKNTLYMSRPWEMKSRTLRCKGWWASW